MKTYYKLTDENMQTRGGFQWNLGKWYETSGEGELCNAGWFHVYTDPLLAMLLNPIHANFAKPGLFEAECEGSEKHDHGLKVGVSRIRITKELPLPDISVNQQVAFGILCAKQLYAKSVWNRWADDWLNNINRGQAAAAAAWAAAEAEAEAAAAWAAEAAADAAAKPGFDLIALAEEAMKEATDGHQTQ